MNPGRIFDGTRNKWIHAVLLTIAATSLLLLIVNFQILAGDSLRSSKYLRENLPLHSALEAIIGITGILLGFSLWTQKSGSSLKHLRLISLGLWSLGVLSLLHAITIQPNEFVFLYSASLLAGAIGFFLCWFPKLTLLSWSETWTPIVVFTLTVIFGLAAIYTSSFGMIMVNDGSFTSSASLINVISGLLFAAAALKVVKDTLCSGKEWARIFLASIAITCAAAGFSFPWSQAWSDGWWDHHFLRLTVFTISLIILQRMHRQVDKEREIALKEKTELSAELKIREERLSLAMEGARDGIWDWDLETNQMFYSAGWSRMLGYKENEIPGTPEILNSLIHPEDFEHAKRAIDDYVTGRISTYSVEFRMKHKNGKYLNILSRGKMTVRESDQKPVRFIGINSDLTDIRNAEKDLRSSLELNETIIRTSPVGTGIYDSKLYCIYVNDSFAAILGLTKDEIFQQPFSHRESWKKTGAYERALKAMETGEVQRFEDHPTLRSGKKAWFDCRMAAFGPTDNRNLLVVVDDITQRKQMLVALEESEARLREFFDITTNLVTQVDENGNLLFVNRQASFIYGISPDQCPGKASLDFIHPDDRARTQESFQKWINEKKTNISFENRLVSPDGRVYEMLWSINPKYDKKGNVIHIWSIARDISDIKAYEKKLQKANYLIDKEKKFSENVINSLPGVFYLFDENLRFKLWNKNLEELTGYNPEELASLSALELFDRDETGLVAEKIEEVFTKGSSSVEAVIISRDGTKTPFYLTGLRIKIKKKNHLLGVGVDISKTKEAEQERELVLSRLQERIKEQECIFTVSEAVKSNDSTDILFSKIIDAVKEGWKYPEITRCRILFDNKIYNNEEFEPTEYKLISKIVSRDEERGFIEVYYLEKRPDLYEGPFLKEERTVLDEIALRIGEAVSIFQSNEDRQVRQEIGEGFLETDENKAYSIALHKILEIMNSQFGMLGYIDQKETMVYPSSTTELWIDLWGKSLAQKKTVVSNKEVPVPEGHIPLKNTISTPILLKDQLVGQINVANSDSDYTRNDIRLMENLARYMAPIIEARRQQEFSRIALQNERYQLQTLFDSTDGIIYVADPETYELLYVNGAFLKIWGGDVIGGKCHKILQERDTPCPFCTNDKIFGENLGKTYVWEFQNEITLRWFRCSDKAITWSDGRQVRFEMATDITESKLYAQEQIRMEKLSTLGQVAAGVAHELNNPLMGVLNYSQYCLTKTDTDDRRYSVLQDIETETKRCTRIVENLLSASRMDDVVSGKVTDFDPVKIVDRVISLLEYRTSKEKIEVLKKSGGNIPRLKMSSDAFQQLFMNLFTNAIDAVDKSSEKQISIETLGMADQLILKISDTGCGIPHDLREKIFDPFYTTKPPGKGTGLGLATCLKIADSQGGNIKCQSRPGYGTTMTITVPREMVKGRYQS